MTDQATPNLPSPDFDSTAAFYERLGSSNRFPGRRLDDPPARGSHAGVLRPPRARSPRELVQLLPEARGRPREGLPAVQIRRHPGNQQRLSAHPCPELQEWGGTMAALVDPDGTLLRLIQNEFVAGIS